MSQHFNEDGKRQGVSPKVLAARDKELCRHIWGVVDQWEAHGHITKRQALDARAHIARHIAAAHYCGDPETYQQGRRSGELDRVLEWAAAGHDPNESDSANEVRQRDVFNQVVALATDIELVNRAALGEQPGMHAQLYHAVQAGADPKSEMRLRKAAGMDEAIDLDGTLRPLEESERALLGGAHFIEHSFGRFREEPTPDRDIAGDAKAFMKSFVESRNEESGTIPIRQDKPDDTPRDELGRFVGDGDEGPVELP